MRRFRNFGSHLVTSRYSLNELLHYAPLLDKSGFDLITVGDHTLIPNTAASYPNAQTILSFLGSITNRIKLSAAVTDPIRRHPVEIAQSTVTLDRLTHGRAMLGIGAGEMMNLEPFGLEYSRPFTRLSEAIDVIKLLWKSSPNAPADYEGEIFRLRRAYLQIKSFTSKPPPIYIGAVGKKTRELVGAKAEGWIPVIESTSSLGLHLEDVKRGLGESRRKIEDVDVTVTFYSEVSDDREAALRTVEPVARTQMIQERSVLQHLTGISVPQNLSVQRILANDPEIAKELQALASSIPIKAVEDITIVGTPEECIKRVEGYLDAGANSFLLVNLSKDQENTFKQYSEKVIPYLRENYGV